MDKIADLLQSNIPAQRLLGLHMMVGMPFRESIPLLKTLPSDTYQSEFALRLLYKIEREWKDTFNRLISKSYYDDRIAGIPKVTSKIKSYFQPQSCCEMNIKYFGLNEK